MKNQRKIKIKNYEWDTEQNDNLCEGRYEHYGEGGEILPELNGPDMPALQKATRGACND